jgi:hypothetical protein
MARRPGKFSTSKKSAIVSAACPREHLAVERHDGRVDDRRDVALAGRAFEEVLARRRSVRRRVQHLVEVDLHEDALVAGKLGVRRQHVDQVPADIVRLVLGAQPASALAEPSSLTMVTCGFSFMKGS